MKQSDGGSAVIAGGGTDRSGDVKIVNTTVRNNRAVAFPTGTNGIAQGGGVFLGIFAAPVIKGSIFSGNLARVSSTGGGVTAQGGGIYLNNGGAGRLRRLVVRGQPCLGGDGGTLAEARGGGIYADFDGGSSSA